MDTKAAIDLVLKKGHTWRRVNQQPCVYTLIGRYYINLCSWNNNGVRTISIDIDDYKRGINNIANLDIAQSNINYDPLMRVYMHALHVAIPA